jgi:hypothetical protein
MVLFGTQLARRWSRFLREGDQISRACVAASALSPKGRHCSRGLAGFSVSDSFPLVFDALPRVSTYTTSLLDSTCTVW